MSKDHVHDPVREEFKKLSLDGKTAFLVEAIFSTAGSAINEIGTRLNSLVSLVTDPFEGSPESAARDDSADSSSGHRGESEPEPGSSSKAKAGKKTGGSGKESSTGK
jgi:hypothetical protein